MHEATLSYRQLILGLWVAWLAYWMISAAGNKATRRRESRASRWSYTITLLAGVALIACPRLELGRLSAPLLPDVPWRFRTALALLAAGLLFTVWARVHLGRNWSGTVTLKEGHELVRTGPYAYVRHPIYTGLIVALLGSAIACGEPRALIGLALVVLSFVHKLRIEEHFMQQVFPGQYERYRATVPALIPFAPTAGG